jgi:hypothetical protein
LAAWVDSSSTTSLSRLTVSPVTVKRDRRSWFAVVVYET